MLNLENRNYHNHSIETYAHNLQWNVITQLLFPSLLLCFQLKCAIPTPSMQFQQMSDECYDKMFILHIIDSSPRLWKGPVHWLARWDRCLISVYSVSLKWAAPCDHLRKLSALITDREGWGHRPSPRCLLSHESGDMVAMKQICSSKLQDIRLSVSGDHIMGLVNYFQCQNLLDHGEA